MSEPGAREMLEEVRDALLRRIADESDPDRLRALFVMVREIDEHLAEVELGEVLRELREHREFERTVCSGAVH